MCSSGTTIDRRTPVDVRLEPAYTAQLRVSMRMIVETALAAVVVSACAARTGDIGRQPVVPEWEAEAVRATAPEAPLRIVFDWNAVEREARYSGRGAARVQPPYRARLDLFGPRGEGYLSAAVVEDDLRLPPDVAAASIPPAPLLWSVLGVFRPPAGARLVATARDGETTRLVYEATDGRWTFTLRGDRLTSAEWERSDGARHTVELTGSATRSVPQEARYRDWAAFTELTLKLDEVERVEPFSPEIWIPGRP